MRPNNKHEWPRVATILYMRMKRQVQCACTIMKVSTVACTVHIYFYNCGKIAGQTFAPTISMNGQEWRQLYTYYV